MLDRIEPSAELRIFANMLRQMYIALQQEGFTTPEALTIIGHCIAANTGGGHA